jgi:hypothetical protein
VGHATAKPETRALLARQEKRWITRLRKLPPDVFNLVVRRIMTGEPLKKIARHLHDVIPDVAEETFRKSLRVLAKQVRAGLVDRKSIDEILEDIDDFDKARTEGALADSQAPRTPSAGSSKRLKATVNRAILDIRAEEMLKYAWVIQQKRVDKMMDLEADQGIVLPGLHKEIATLTAIAEAVTKHEVGIALMKRKGNGIPELNTTDKLSPLAEKISKLDAIDRNLIREASSKVISLVQDQFVESKTQSPANDTENPKDTNPDK